jgi:hypothetical protein
MLIWMCLSALPRHISAVKGYRAPQKIMELCIEEAFLGLRVTMLRLVNSCL